MGIDKCEINGLGKIPSWAQFFISLGKLLYSDFSRSHAPLKIIVTLPTDSLELALLAAAGMGDSIFNSTNNEQDYIEIFKQMPVGQTVYYMENGARNICTFLGLTYSEIFKERAIRLKRNNDEITLIESKWFNIQLSDQKEYKIARKIKGDGISSSFLYEVYDTDILKKVMIVENEIFYIVGNVKEIERISTEDNFTCNNKKGNLNDFIRADKLCSVHDYTHTNIISKRRDDRIELHINEKVPVIFTDASSYLNKKELFNTNPCLIFLSRLDNEINLESVTLDIDRRLKECSYKNVTQELVAQIESKNNMPNGIELFGWREQNELTDL